MRAPGDIVVLVFDLKTRVLLSYQPDRNGRRAAEFLRSAVRHYVGLRQNVRIEVHQLRERLLAWAEIEDGTCRTCDPK